MFAKFHPNVVNLVLLETNFKVTLHRQWSIQGGYLHIGIHHDQRNIIFALDEGSAAEKNGNIRVGDHIQCIDDEVMTSAKQTDTAIKKAGKNVVFSLKRIPYDKSKNSAFKFKKFIVYIMIF